jgi:hypothetical protein
MRRLITFLAFLLLLGTCMSCRSSRGWTKTSSDTVRTIKPVHVPGITVKFEPKLLPMVGDTLLFIKDSVRTKVVFEKGETPQGKDTVFVAVVTECPDQVVNVPCDTAITNNFKKERAGIPRVWVVLYCLLCLIAGVGIGRIFR